MHPKHHEVKARRFEASLRKLRASDDCEAIIWACMQAGTHWINAALHTALGDSVDLEHSNLIGLSPSDPNRLLRPQWPASLPGKLDVALKELAAIENLRPLYVRGPKTDTPGASSAYRHYMRLKRYLGLLQHNGHTPEVTRQWKLSSTS